MNKKSPFFTATVASIVYFMILLTLKYFLPINKNTENVNIDWLGTLEGAVVFWIVIFAVHQLLKLRSSE